MPQRYWQHNAPLLEEKRESRFPLSQETTLTRRIEELNSLHTYECGGEGEVEQERERERERERDREGKPQNRQNMSLVAQNLLLVSV